MTGLPESPGFEGRVKILGRKAIALLGFSTMEG